MTISPLGDSALVIVLGEPGDPIVTARVQAIAAEMTRHPPPGVVDVVPAFASLGVYLDPTIAGAFDRTRQELERLLGRTDLAGVNSEHRTVEIPVCYGDDYGPDLERVATHAGLSASEVVALHAGADYLVDAIGFAPGFPYLRGLPAALAAPRRATPRPQVPVGSVGIGGAQTGVYPLNTPGGWNLIGRTPLRLFDPGQEEPALLQPGDRVKFRPITLSEYGAISQAQAGLRCDASRTPRGGINGNPAVNVRPQGEPEAGSVAAGPAIQVVRAGMYTSVQDLGRRGYRSRGVPLGGAADTFALRLANSLVGNPEDAAALEFTLIGPELTFLQDTTIALAGGEFGGVSRWVPQEIRSGTTVKFGPARSGCRGYLAAAGGIDVEPVLGSRSTYARADLGGFEGRALRDGDVLRLPSVCRHFRPHWRIDERILPEYSGAPRLRVLAGAHAGQFAADWTEATFRVSPQSDRMGVRLIGPPLARTVRRDLVSSPVAPGTIQVPPNGQPIILLADAQTIGGYPQIAHVISVDLPLVAQLKPGDCVRCHVVELPEARELMAAQDRALALLREGLAQKLA